MNREDRPVVLITGCCGLIGSALAHRLADRYAVSGFDLKNSGYLPPEMQFVCVDLTDERSIASGLEEVRQQQGGRIASVIHLAAYYDFSGEPSPLYDRLTVEGTQQLLRRLRQHGFSLEQFVFASTMLVHAPCDPGERITEDSPLLAKWDYPRSKIEAERLVHRERGATPIVILRLAGLYDAMCRSIPLAHQIQRIYEKRLTGYVYPGNLQCGQAFLHMDDLLDCVERIIERRRQLPPETVLLVGEPETVSYGEVQERLGRLIHDKDWTTIKVPKTVAKVGAWIQDRLPTTEDPFIKPWMVDMADDHYALDISRAEQLLGWQPKHRLYDVLPAMVEALQNDPVGWYCANDLDPSSITNQAIVV